VGGNKDLTIAIWVGYADKLQPMEYEHGGAPVAGGTFPAEIFHDFMTSWLEIRQARRLERAANKQTDDESTTTGVAPAVPVTPTETPPTSTAPTEPSTGGTDQGGTGGGGGGGGGQTQQAPPQNDQPAQPPSTPAQPETPPPTGGDGGGVSPGGTP
jgi:penicillin-binding protein 1A